MSWVQRVILAVVPRAWAAEMEAETRAWTLTCTCGHERSLWDLGGLIWKGKRRVRRYYVRCPACGQRAWHTLALKA